MRGTSQHRVALSLALAVLAPLFGCAATRDFAAPEQRITDGTAYTLTHRQMRVNAGLVGVGTADMGVNVGLAYGVGDWIEFGVNLAHAGVGLLNVTTKVNLVDQPLWGLGLQLQARWLHGSWMWILPADTREQLADVDYVDLPLSVIASFPLFRWMGLHLQFGYSHSEVFGNVQGNDAALDGRAGTREVFLEPVIRFYLWERLALTFGTHLPLYARAAVRAAAEDQLEPDLIVGVNSALWRDVPFNVLASYYGGIELQFGKYTFMQIYAVHGLINEAISSPVLPSLNFYWRF